MLGQVAGASLTADVLVVFALVLVVVVLFVTEALPPDTTAIGLVVALVVLDEWTHVGPSEALSGFANPATLTIVAMYVLSAGVQGTGAIAKLGRVVSGRIRGDRSRLLGATVGITGPLAGIVNNTPVVAMFIPMVSDLADETHVSRSKVLIPLSYAAMLGGTLTLVGTATNVLASDLTASLAPAYPNADLHAFSMFEFTPLGVVVFLVGAAYLLTVAQWLLPERIAAVDLTEEFDLSGWLSRAYVRRDSPLVGTTVAALKETYDLDVDVIQILRGEEGYLAPATDREIRAGDVLTVRARDEAFADFVEAAGLRSLPRAPVTEAELDLRNGGGTLAAVVLAPDSTLDGETVATSRLRERFDATVLAARRGGTLFHEDLPDVRLTDGTSLLLHLTAEELDHLRETGDVIVTDVAGAGVHPDAADALAFDPRRAALAVAIVLSVVGLAAVGALPIAIAALGGVVAMIATDLLAPAEAYDAVNWEVIFLLAGVFPLGVAIRETGGAALLAETIASTHPVLPALAVLGAFYLLTGLLANLVTPIASVVLVLPVAVDTAARIGSEPFSFALAVTFGASTAFMTPIGYQTNLMVYSPGGYTFSDYVTVGAPLQALLTVVTAVGIGLFWGV